VSTIAELFESFIRERRYLSNLSEGTLTYYREVFNNFSKEGAFNPLSKQSLTNTIIKFKERGVKVGAINTYVRGINVFLRWLSENGHCELLRLPPLKGEQRILRSLTDAELKAILSYKQKNRTERRLHTILCVLTDAGLRINEALTLEKSKIDFDNLLLTVRGKGSKERIVPFSYELRRILFRYLSKHKFELVFCNRYDGKLRYDNVRRDFNNLMVKLQIDCDSAFHAFRRTFATNFVRSGGNPLVLQRLLGHTTLMQTNKYVKLVTEDLSIEQHRTSILNRLR
jgi:Site-specific recombinase XerD